MSREIVCARYFMYNNPERTQAWRLDVANDGEQASFWVNGRPVNPGKNDADAVLKALTALDTAFGALMLALPETRVEKP